MVRGVFCLHWDVFSHANRGKLQFSLFCGLSLGGELLGSGCNFGNWKASSWNLCLLLFFIVFSFSGCLVVSSSYLNSSAKLFLFVKLGHIKLAYRNLCTLIVVYVESARHLGGSFTRKQIGTLLSRHFWAQTLSGTCGYWLGLSGSEAGGCETWESMSLRSWQGIPN